MSAVTPPEPLSRWHHPKTDAYYVVLGVSTQSTNGVGCGTARVVVYWSETYKKLCHRDLDEFLDGRFVPAGTSPWSRADLLSLFTGK